MNKIIEKERCTGCAACSCICPKNCIKMTKDNEGFYYPEINEEECIDCGLCLRTCPIINCNFIEDEHLPEAYLTCAKDKNTRLSGASGGTFLTIAKSFFERFTNCVVVGAAYNESFQVEHIIIDNSNDVKCLAKSKYVQSNTNGLYVEIKNLLQKGTVVLFSGTPCQVYGLKSYLKKEYTNLYCVDVVCHGVPSPLIFEKYLDWHKEKNGRIRNVESRAKRICKNRYIPGMRIEFETGKKYFASNEDDYFGRLFWGEIASRPSCYSCKFKTLNRISDLTVGDCWFSKEFIGKDDNYGYTLVFIQSERGKELFNLIESKIDSYPIDSESAIKANGGMLYKSATMNPKRNVFFADIEAGKDEFDTMVEKYCPVNRFTIIKKVIRRIPYLYPLWKNYTLRKDFNARMKRTIPDSAKGKIII